MTSNHGAKLGGFSESRPEPLGAMQTIPIMNRSARTSDKHLDLIKTHK